MFPSFYNLREQPFGVTPDPRYLYLSGTHGRIISSLLYGINCDLGFTALIGEPGTGKTTLLFHILRSFRTALTAFLFETQCNSNGLLRYLLQELDVPIADNDPVALHEQLKEVLASAALSGRRVILIIDEAQNLDLSVLETVRLLSNFETPRAKLLHVILSGQPDLALRLARPELAQLQQRIGKTNWLMPLAPEDVACYIEHRLRVAGCTGTRPFSDAAVDMIAAESRGIPRVINRISFNALSLGYSLRKTEIDAAIVEQAVSDCGSSPLDFSRSDASAGNAGNRASVLPMLEPAVAPDSESQALGPDTGTEPWQKLVEE